jgi:NAD+ synthase
MFDAVKVKNDIVKWLREWFDQNGKDCKAVIGISGGKDSTVVAALCVEALGKERVRGMLMPNGEQKDIKDAERVCEVLDIPYLKVNINGAYEELMRSIGHYPPIYELSEQTQINLPPRLRMATLYAVAALYPNSRVVNTCNFSEDYVGYSTKYGDAAGDFSPLGRLTVREVLQIGDDLGLPYELVHKTPSDGMCGKTDEDNLGFTYDELDGFLLCERGLSPETMSKVARLHKSTRHKYVPMPVYNPSEDRK